MTQFPFFALIASLAALSPLSLPSARAAAPTPPPELVTTTRVGTGFGELKVVESRLDPGAGPDGAEPEIRALARTQPMGWRLFVDLKPIAPAPDDGPDAGYFLLRFPLSAARAGVPFYLIGPEGEISHGLIHAKVGDADLERLRVSQMPVVQTSAPRKAAQNQPKSSYFHAGLALPFLSFQQSGLARYSQLALTPQLSARLPFARGRARASLNAAFTLLPLIKSGGISARTLDLDGQVRYGWPVGPGGRWSIYVNGGAYYRTMLVTRDQFGFHNISGPLLYPSIRRAWATGGSAGAYIRLSPITDGLAPLGLASHDLALGADWAMVLRNRHFLTISADVNAFRMVFSDVEMSSLSFALGVKYGI